MCVDMFKVFALSSIHHQVRTLEMDWTPFKNQKGEDKIFKLPNGFTFNLEKKEEESFVIFSFVYLQSVYIIQ